MVVVCSSWSGWSEGYEPEEKNVYPLVEGEKIELTTLNMDARDVYVLGY